jgi:teichuronic acid biosynthesis glycosyltransferase TuaH
VTRRRIVVFSLERWDEIWRRNQYLVDGLLRADPELEVVFVEPPRDVSYELMRGRRPRFGDGLRRDPGYDGRLSLFQPTKLLPRAAGPMAELLMARAVTAAIRTLGGGVSDIWINDPAWADFAVSRGVPVLYDMTDDWVSAARTPREHDRLVRWDDLLLERAQNVVVCSSGLLESRRPVRPDAVLIPNAVDVARYRRATDRPGDLADRSAVYVGTLHEDRLDLTLVEQTGSALAGVGGELVLIGPDALSEENSRRVQAMRGVTVLGPRPFAAIPAYLQHADALVVPHVVDAFTESLDPIKLYEYRAVGRPVLSTPVAGFRDLAAAEGVDIRTADVFPARAAELVVDRRPTLTDIPIPDWDTRVDEFDRLLRRRPRTPDAGPGAVEDPTVS